MKKLGILTLFLMFAFVTQAANLFDDFEGYDLGLISEVTEGAWTGGNASVTMPVLGNKVLDVTGNNDPARRALGAMEIGATDTETTVFFRAKSPSLANPDTLIGVTDNTAPDTYSHMQAYIQFTNDYIRARNGGSIVELLPFTVNQWYNVWIVVNNNANTYDVYVNQGTADATAGDLYADNFGFRYSNSNPIRTFANVYGDGAVIDDVYITPGLDLTNPPLPATAPEADDMTRYLWDAELPVENGGFTQPGIASTGTIDVPGWTDNNAPYSPDTGTRNNDNSDGDGWHFSQNIHTDQDNGPIWQITSTPMVEGVTYTFTADVQGRWNCDGVELSVVTGPYTGSDPNAPAGGGDPNVPLVTTAYAIGGNDVWYDNLAASYTATTSDAGNLIGISIQGTSTVNIDNSWMRIDNIHLYDSYLAVHGAMDPTPANEATGVTPGTVTLSWTPSNDPNVIGQDLVYYVDDYLNFADIPGYNSSAVSVPLGGAVSTADISADVDQYVIWRVDTVTDVNNFTGDTWYFINKFTDEFPDVVAGSGWLTYVGGTMPILTADVNDFGEGDIADADVIWTVDIPWEPTDPTVMQMYDRSGNGNLATLAGLGYDPDLFEDWIGSDVRDDNWTYDPLVLTLSGVPTGTYTWTSYHHDVADQTGPFDVTVIDSSGSTTTTGLDVTNGTQEPNQVFTTTITSDGSDIKLLFDNQGNSNETLFFVMNGFDLVGGSVDLKVDFGTPTTAVASGYEAYTAEHESAATFTTQTFGSISVTPTWGPGEAYGATATVTKTVSQPVSTADFNATYQGDYTVTITATDTHGSLGPQEDSDTLIVRVAPDACTGAAVWGGAGYNYYDSDEDCDVDIIDFAAFALEWLDDISLTGSVAE